MGNRPLGELRQADSFDSSARLLWGFIGALLIAAMGKIFEGSQGSDIWMYTLLVVLVVTSYGLGLLAAAYNGFISGLFFNFFFSSTSGDLSLDAAGDWWLQLIFVAVGVAAGLFGGWIGGGSNDPQTEPAPDPQEQGQTFLWKSRSST